MKKLLASLALAIAAFGMVGGTASAAPARHLTALQVAARLAPWGCHATVPPPYGAPSPYGATDVGVVKPQSILVCNVTGVGFVEIDQYVTPAQVTRAVQLARSPRCLTQGGIAGFSGYLPYILVSNVTVTADGSTGYAVHGLEWRLQQVIGAGVTLKRVLCGAPTYVGQQRVP